MALDLKTRLNISDNEVDIATKIMRGNVNHIVLDEEIKKKATISIASVLLNKAKEIAKRAKEGKTATPNKVPDASSPQGTKNITNKAADAPDDKVLQGPKNGEPTTWDNVLGYFKNRKPNTPATQGTRDVTTNAPATPKGGVPAPQGTRDITNKASNGPSGGVPAPQGTRDVANPDNTSSLFRGGKTISPYSGVAVGSIIGGAAGTSLMSRSNADPSKVINNDKKPSETKPTGNGSDSIAAPRTNTNKPSTGSTAPSTGSGASTSPAKPSPAAKVIRKGSIVAPKKELSADDLNSISYNLAKGKDAGSSGALNEPMSKEKNTAAENIKKRLDQLNKEETDFTKMKEKKYKGKFEPVDDAPVERIENKRKPVKFGEPGNEKLSNEEFDQEYIDQEYINGIMEAEASSSHTGKIKSSKRIIKTLQKVLERGEPEDFQFENGTTVTLQPAMARMAVGYYNKLSEFEKAQAAKIMRQSFKDFLSIAKRK